MFSLAYTSCRAHLIIPVIAKWLASADSVAEIETVVSIDLKRSDCFSAGMTAEKSFPNTKLVVHPDQETNCVKGWNLAAANTRNPVIIAISDDFEPPIGWDTKLKKVGEEGWWFKKKVIHTEDGFVSRLCTLPIFTRSRYLDVGYFYWPEYESMFADTEFTDCAYRDGVVIDAKHLLFEHKHPNCQKRDWDSHDLAHSGRDRWNRGEALYNKRKAANFPPVLVA